MKKITTLLSLVLVTSVGFAQSTFETAKEMGDATATTVVYETQTPSLAPCEQDVPSNNYENGWGPTNNPDIIWADDFEVAADETFTVTQIGFNYLTEPGVSLDDSDIIFYEDTGDGPGAEIAYLSTIDVVSDDIVGTAFGFDARRIVFDIDPMDFSGADGTVYWVGFVTSYTGANSYFEVTSVVETPNEVYVYDAAEGFWIPGKDAFADPQTPSDFVMTVSGECNPLSVGDNLLSEVSVYPSPATDVLNISLPSNVEVESATLFSILGENTGVSYSNGKMNVSGLSSGVYFLNLETNLGAYTQKIVKQ
ncbi:T9SS type A sorting domain-containing protein [Aequorivita marina]|uniref:T9SS type A sorting domain-containing protein n=1 Tax=Aequorivita marina TaxID=3073654 RepID=UPI0028742518|nr:T9SS type A sorting domain-containing protein [Aequorivita sp. S2608]MDS1298323.1 T9SS type A sorting domain-containing protein [Aequorivita sp. S2608]